MKNERVFLFVFGLLITFTLSSCVTNAHAPQLGLEDVILPITQVPEGKDSATELYVVLKGSSNVDFLSEERETLSELRNPTYFGQLGFYGSSAFGAQKAKFNVVYGASGWFGASYVNKVNWLDTGDTLPATITYYGATAQVEPYFQLAINPRIRLRIGPQFCYSLEGGDYARIREFLEDAPEVEGTLNEYHNVSKTGQSFSFGLRYGFEMTPQGSPTFGMLIGFGEYGTESLLSYVSSSETQLLFYYSEFAAYVMGKTIGAQITFRVTNFIFYDLQLTTMIRMPID